MLHPIVVGEASDGRYEVRAGIRSYSLAHARLDPGDRVYVLAAPSASAEMRALVDSLVTPALTPTRGETVRSWAAAMDDGEVPGGLLADESITVGDVCRYLGISRSTYFTHLRRHRET